MNIEEFLLRTYCWVDDEIKALELGRLRPRGFEPKLRDSEVITLEIAGEYLGRDKDTDIFSFFRRYHRGEFPALAQVDRTTFVQSLAVENRPELRPAIETAGVAADATGTAKSAPSAMVVMRSASSG